MAKSSGISPTLYYIKWCSETPAVFQTAPNQGQRVLENAKLSYEQLVHNKVENKRLVSCEFWKITYKIHNRGKVSVCAITIDFEVIKSSFDKAMNFALNSTLDKKSHPLPDFSFLTEHKLCNISIRALEVSRFIKRLDSKKDTSLDEILVVGL